MPQKARRNVALLMDGGDAHGYSWMLQSLMRKLAGTTEHYPKKRLQTSSEPHATHLVRGFFARQGPSCLVNLVKRCNSSVGESYSALEGGSDREYQILSFYPKCFAVFLGSEKTFESWKELTLLGATHVKGNVL